MIKLNLGCQKRILGGYINIDIKRFDGVNLVWNLNKYPYPYKDGEVDEVIANHILEHLDSIQKPLKELHRIVKNNGIIKITVPITPSVWAFIDPTHKQYYTYFTTEYYDVKNYPEVNEELGEFGYFKVKRKIVFNKYCKLFELIVNYSELTKKIWAIFLYGIFPAENLELELENVKQGEAK
jgi:ubiquinone/menaquinone biosynthesis C-methylase UbiE